MRVIRKTEIDTDVFRVGDQINVRHYTATCQKVEEDGAVFLLDQYLDEAMPMNRVDTNDGGYEASDLRKRLNSTDILDIFVFSDVGNELVPLDNGDLFRIPYFSEIFGWDDLYDLFVEPDDYNQWPLMAKRQDRIACRRGVGCEFGWLQNKRIARRGFCVVTSDGFAADGRALNKFGVRLVFKIRL